MILRPPRATRTDTPVPLTTLCRAGGAKNLRGPGRDHPLFDRDLDWRIEPPGDFVAKLRPLLGPVFAHEDDAFDAHASIVAGGNRQRIDRSEEHTSELQSLMRISYAVFCLKKKNNKDI